jgi:hypothetical protein
MAKRHVVLALAWLAAPVACGTNVDLGGSADATADTATSRPDAMSPTCPGYAPPDAAAKCFACNAGSKGCQANGCYNGYYCKLSPLDCRSMKDACDAGAAEDGRSD